jgi:hypothetical protein
MRRKKNDPERLDHEFFPAKERYRYDRVVLLSALAVIFVLVIFLSILFKNLFL